MKIYYLPSHEYIKVEDNIGLVGISEYAAKQLGTVTYVDMPEEGDDVEKEEVFGAVESRKAASGRRLCGNSEVRKDSKHIKNQQNQFFRGSAQQNAWELEERFTGAVFCGRELFCIDGAGRVLRN